jgi:hypothetical protein
MTPQVKSGFALLLLLFIEELTESFLVQFSSILCNSCVDFYLNSLVLFNRLQSILLHLFLSFVYLFVCKPLTIVVYDITNAESYNGKVDEWLREITNYTDADTPIVLVGNKVDLEEKRAVDVSTVKQWAASNKMPYIETSAKTGKGVAEVFTTLAEKMLELRAKKKSATSPPPQPQVEVKQSNGRNRPRRCMI